MDNEYYGAPTTPTTDYLAHYGVKGMKWGVRKAAARGAISGAAGFANKSLGRQYRKAQRKLAKLEKRAASGKKYAKRAAALGAGAAAAGGLAAAGTLGVAKGVGAAGSAFSQGAKGAGALMQRVGGAMQRRGIRGGGRMTAAGKAVEGLGKHNASGVARSIQTWGGGTGIGSRVGGAIEQGTSLAKKVTNKVGRGTNFVDTYGGKLAKKAKGISNSGYARIAAAGTAAGLGAGAAYNAYRAATTKRAARKAAEFRREMNKAFAGTSYANAPRTPQKKRRRG